MRPPKQLIRLAARALATLGFIACSGAAVLALEDLESFEGIASPGFFWHLNGHLGPPALRTGLAVPLSYALQPDTRIVQVDGLETSDGAAIWDYLRARPVGDQVVFEFDAPNAKALPLDSSFEIPATSPDLRRRRIEFSTHALTRGDLFSNFGILIVSGWLICAIGCAVLFFRPGAGMAWALAATALGLGGGVFVLLIDHFLTYRLAWSVGPYGVGLARAGLVHLALVFPEEHGPIRRWPGLTLAAIYATVPLQGLLFARYFESGPASLFPISEFTVMTLAGAGVLAAASMTWSAFRGATAGVRRQARIVLLAPVFSLGTVAVLFVQTWGLVDLPFPPALAAAPIWIIAGVLAFAMLKHNLFELDVFLRRLVVGMVRATTLLLVLLAIGVFLPDGIAPGTRVALLFGLGVVVLGLLASFAPPQEQVESFALQLFPRQRRAIEAIHEASDQLARLGDTNDVVEIVDRALRQSVSAANVALIDGDDETGFRERRLSEEGQLEESPAEASLVGAVKRGRTIDLLSRRGRSSRAVRDALSARGASLLLPFPGDGQGTGALLLGGRTDGRLYSSDDLRLIGTFAAQCRVALANARAWGEVKQLESRLQQENLYLREEVAANAYMGAADPDASQEAVSGIVGQSWEIRAALAQLDQVARSDATVLVVGETGTGKELAVRELHRVSRRSEQPLVKVACAAIPESLLESELFGHEKGAFTGASQRKIGRLEVADRGTVFFDDIDTLPMSIQAKLLRALQEGEVQRVGSNDIIQVDFRVIAATNRNLLDEVSAGRFRADLFYRINVVPIQLPPLRARKEDIPSIVEHTVRACSFAEGREITEIDSEALAALVAYEWPGNVRELRNVIERAMVLGEGPVLRLPGPLVDEQGAAAPNEGSVDPVLGEQPLNEMLRIKKAQWIEAALRASDGNQRRAAELLGLHRPSLSRMIRDLGIEVSKS